MLLDNLQVISYFLFYKFDANISWVLYMSSSFWLFGVESPDFSHAEKERSACEAEQIHKKYLGFSK